MTNIDYMIIIKKIKIKSDLICVGVQLIKFKIQLLINMLNKSKCTMK